MKEDADTKKALPKSNAGEVSRTTRDLLLILLTGSAGSIDAAIFLARDFAELGQVAERLGAIAAVDVGMDALEITREPVKRSGDVCSNQSLRV